MKKSFVLGLVLSLALVFFTSPSFASLGVSQAILDVSSLFDNTNVSWDSSTYSTFTSAKASDTLQSLSGSTSAANWNALNKTLTTAPEVLAAGQGNATTSIIQARAKADTTSAQLPAANGYAERSGSFKYTGSVADYVTFTLPYTLRYDLLSSAGSSAYAEGSAQITVSLFRTSGELPLTSAAKDEYVADVSNDQFPIYFTTDTANGRLNAVVRVWFQPDEMGQLVLTTEAITKAGAPVPIPAAFWLLGSGLVGLIGIRRRKK